MNFTSEIGNCSSKLGENDGYSVECSFPRINLGFNPNPNTLGDEMAPYPYAIKF
jgi:hypothetical protein